MERVRGIEPLICSTYGLLDSTGARVVLTLCSPVNWSTQLEYGRPLQLSCPLGSSGLKTGSFDMGRERGLAVAGACSQDGAPPNGEMDHFGRGMMRDGQLGSPGSSRPP